MWQFLRKHAKALAVIIITLIAINALFFWISPKELVDKIGVDNSYLIVFLIATFGGLSSFTSAALYSAIASFAAGGAVPWLIGLIGGIGIAIGDTFIFLLIRYGYKSIQDDSHEKLEHYKERLHNLPKGTQYVVLYLILGVTPVPNDIIMAFLVFAEYRLRAILPILILADITIALITAYTGGTILDYFFS